MDREGEIQGRAETGTYRRRDNHRGKHKYTQRRTQRQTHSHRQRERGRHTQTCIKTKQQRDTRDRHRVKQRDKHTDKHTLTDTETGIDELDTDKIEYLVVVVDDQKERDRQSSKLSRL